MDGIVTRKDAIAAGLKAYFTGKPCKRGHIAKRYTANFTCSTCFAESLPKYEDKRKAWFAANAERRKAEAKVYRETNKPRILEKKRRYRAENPDKCRKTAQNWNKNNREKRNELSRLWRKANKDFMLDMKAKRRAEFLNRIPAWLTDEDRSIIRQKYRLAAELSRTIGVQWHVDHIIPLCGKTVSGLHVPSNLQVIPAKENMSKGNRIDALCLQLTNLET
jgi:hypothetical protein